jgi:hypothetical protein
VTVEDDFETAMVGQLDTKRVTQAAQGETDMIVTGRLDGLRHDAQGTDIVDIEIHSVFAGPLS